MILFSSRNLELAFAREELTKWDKVKYIILMTVIFTTTYGPIYWAKPIYGARQPSLDKVISFSCSVLAAYIAYRGIKKCFQINENIDGISFFERWACLTVPVGFRLTLYFLPVVFAISGLFTLFKSSDPEPYRMLPIAFNLLGPIWSLTYYHLLKRSFLQLGELLPPNCRLD